MRHKANETVVNVLTGFVILFTALMFSSAKAADTGRQFMPLHQKASVRPLSSGQGERPFLSLRKAKLNTESRMMAINGATAPQGWKLNDLRQAPRIAKTNEIPDEMKLAMAQKGVPHAASEAALPHAEPEAIAAALAPVLNAQSAMDEDIDTDIEDVHEALVASLPVASQAPAEKARDYVWPVADAHYSISSPYGYRKHPITGKRAFHAGIDIPAPVGTAVLAAADGEVTGVGEHPRLGRYVKVSHADGSYSLYGHLQKWVTQMGAHVQAGEVVGKVGVTGRTTGPHLDFSIRRDGKPFNPMSILASARDNEKKLAMNK